MTHIVIPHRFRGPVDSGNGGYTCGIVAGFVEGDAEVTLRAPPPLDRPLAVRDHGGQISVFDGDNLIAQGNPVEWDLSIPEPPTFDEAVEAATGYAGLTVHAFPECFVCGTDRPDGLRIYSGPVGARDLVASPWVPDSSLPNTNGVLPPEMAWAALDCPGAWAEERQMEHTPVVLGRMAAKVLTTVEVGRRFVALGWPIGRQGRKLFSGTALFTDAQELVGFARQTWIVIAD